MQAAAAVRLSQHLPTSSHLQYFLAVSLALQQDTERIGECSSSGVPMTFVPETAVILQFAIATFIIAITPGPDMTLFVGRALSEGRGAGLACMFGAMTGCVIHTTMVALGLSALIVASPQAFLVLSGRAIWSGWHGRRSPRARRSRPTPGRGRRDRCGRTGPPAWGSICSTRKSSCSS